MPNYVISAYMVESIQAASSLTELQKAVSTYLDDYGFSTFAFEIVRGTQQANKTLSLMTNYPDEWIERYIKEGYFRDDPVHRRAHGSLVPFEWSDILDSDVSQKAGLIFREAGEFNIRDGLTIPTRGMDQTISIFSVVPDGIRPEREEALKRHTGALTVLAPLLHEQVLKIIHAKKNPRKDGGTLTEREKEVLKWIAIGKTTNEISRILQISSATVNDHAAVSAKD